MQVASAQLGCVVAENWLGEKFRDDKLLSPVMHPDHGPPFYRQIGPSEISEFTSQRAVPVMSALLSEMEHVLMMAVGMMPVIPGSGGKGGRRRLVARNQMLNNLVTCWCDLGRKPTAGPKSGLPSFCECPSFRRSAGRPQVFRPLYLTS